MKKLEADGLVRSHVEPQEGRPDRRVYDLTPEGLKDLQDWLAQPLTSIEPRKETLLLKLFFSANIDGEVVLTMLRLQRSLHQAELEKYRTSTRQVIDQFAASPKLGGQAMYWEATRRFGEMYEEMYLAWLDETIKKIEPQ